MKENFYKEGFDLTIQNAENLFKLGEMAAGEGLYGNACSLNVLAAEEAVKAAFILVPHYSENNKLPNNYAAMFSQHRLKHTELKAFIVQQEELRKRTIIQMGIFQGFSQIATTIAPNKKHSTEFMSLMEDLDWYKRQAEIEFDVDEILKWIKRADDIKNAGLYVDEKDKKHQWFSPTMITKEKYESEKVYTKTIILYMKSLDEWFSRTQNINNKMSDESNA